MDRKKIAIIGAGISGLAAGVYLENSGFDVTIFEQHNVPGGLSTGWNRKGYFFEGGMHWLTGSARNQSLNRVWHQVGALQENNPVFNRPVITSVPGGMPDGSDLHLYRDLKKLCAHLAECSPQDVRAIKKLRRDVKRFEKIHQPINDIAGLRTDLHMHPSLGELVSMLPAGLRYARLHNQAYGEYLSMFRNKNIRTLLGTIISSEQNALSFVYTLASYTKGDSGFPQGGSMRMAQNMADRFVKLGGKILYKTRVQSVSVENGKTRGVIVNGNLVPFDAAIVSFDTLSAMGTVVPPTVKEPWFTHMQKTVVEEQCMFAGLGVEADLSHYPFSMSFALDTPIVMGASRINTLRIYNYPAQEGYAPAGCSTLTCLLLGRSYSWWKQKKDEGSYAEEKRKALDVFCGELQKHIPELEGKIAVRDLATPCTYERYTACCHGSWMSLWPARAKSFRYPVKAKTVQGLYFANERNKMPGGLPMCVWAGRIAAQTVCRDFKTVFRCRNLDVENQSRLP